MQITTGFPWFYCVLFENEREAVSGESRKYGDASKAAVAERQALNAPPCVAVLEVRGLL